MVKTENFIQVEITTANQLREWLQKNHTQQESIWLVSYKKEIKEKYVSVQEVLDELLCFGWIDGVRRKLDEQKTMQLISPRQVQHWTKTYKDRFAKLEKEGRMTDAGRATVELSKQNGTNNFYGLLPDSISNASGYFGNLASGIYTVFVKKIVVARQKLPLQLRLHLTL